MVGEWWRSLRLEELPRVSQSCTSSWTAWPLTIEPIGCPETSVTSYQYTLRNIQEKWRSYLRLAQDLKSRNGRRQMERLYWILPGGTEEHHKERWSGLSTAWSRFRRDMGSLITCSFYRPPCISYRFAGLPYILLPWKFSVRWFSTKGVLYYDVSVFRLTVVIFRRCPFASVLFT